MDRSEVGEPGEKQAVTTRVSVGESGVTAPVSPTSQLGRAVERFNRRALRVVRPGSRWLMASVKLGFIMKAAAVVVGVAVLATQSALGYEVKDVSRPSDNIPELVFLLLVLAPLLETTLIWLIYASTRRWLGLTGFVLASAVLAYAGHYTPNSVPIAIALVFSAMSYQYVSFRDEIGASRAFAGVAVSHAVYNGFGALILSLEVILERHLL